MTAYAAETVSLSNVKCHAPQAWVSMSASSWREFPVPGEASTVFLMCTMVQGSSPPATPGSWARLSHPTVCTLKTSETVYHHGPFQGECLMPTRTMRGCVN